jgi:predicted dehydrogenase
MEAISAGKHVYSEKPLGATLDEGKKLVEAAAAKGVRIGGAPDTFLGAGIQTCRKAIDAGLVGKPVGASAFMVCRGHETWHPDPEFYYKHGGGPMLDMGPYYITALVNLLGGGKEICGMAKKTFPKRTITSAQRFGTVVDVDVDTYVAGIMEFANGAIGTIFTTFDAHAAQMPCIEIYGTEGTLSVPDPNTFGGPVTIFRPQAREWKEIPLMFAYAENSRGLGLADMAKAIKTGRKARAESCLTYHVLEIMEGFGESSRTRSFVKTLSNADRPAPMSLPELEGVLD